MTATMPMATACPCRRSGRPNDWFGVYADGTVTLVKQSRKCGSQGLLQNPLPADLRQAIEAVNASR